MLVPTALNAFRSVGFGHQYSDLTDLVPTLGVVAMVAALMYWLLARRAPLAWLLALATFAGGIALARLLTGAASAGGGATVQDVARSIGSGQFRGARLDLVGFATSPDGLVVALALGCVGAALVALRRPPDSSPGTVGDNSAPDGPA